VTVTNILCWTSRPQLPKFMRSQVIHRSRTLLKASSSAPFRRPFILSEGRSRLPRKEQVALRTTRTWKRLASSAKSPPIEDGEVLSADAPPAALPDPPSEDADKADPEKPKRRTRASAPSKDSDPPQLPAGLDVLWAPETNHLDVNSHSLPPPEILEEALNNLHITLHPQTQHRACYPSASSPSVEPTLAFYCPMEGGEYVIDETVRELARRTGSEVVVVDAVQLAAGEWGHFGKGELIFKQSNTEYNT
jgi:hypothetical protein